MKQINQSILSVILVFAGIYLGIWLFNHVNPWLGIGTAILTIYLLIRYLFKKGTQKND